MKLYYTKGTCALACWIALEWAGADYEVEAVDPRSESYRRINPLGMVPAIDVGVSRPMTQADAILQFIAEKYPASQLGADEGLQARFEFNETMCFLTGDFHPAFWPFFSPQRYTTSASEKDLAAVREASYARIDRVMLHLDDLIGESGRLYKGRRSVADAYAFVMAGWSDRIPKTWRSYPRLSSFMTRMAADAAVSKVMQLSTKR